MVIFYLGLSQSLIMITMFNDVPGHTPFTGQLRIFGELHNFEAVALHGGGGSVFYVSRHMRVDLRAETCPSPCITK